MHSGEFPTSVYVCMCVCPCVCVCVGGVNSSAYLDNCSLQELAADKSRLDEVNSEAVRLIAEGHSGEQIIHDHRSSLNARSAGH